MSRIIETKLGLLELDEKIGNGNFRECYTIKDRNDICIKIFKKQDKFFRKIQFFFMRNMNLNEEKIYKKLPKEIQHYFNPVLDAHKDYIVVGRPIDYDGQFSKPVKILWSIKNESFWGEIKILYDYLLEKNIWFFDIFSSNNVIVIKKNNTEWKPIVIDYKRLGSRFYFQQINLILKSERQKKFKRRYKKFEVKHKV